MSRPRRWLLGVLVAVAVTGASLQAAPRSVEAGGFVIIGEDPVSVLYAAHLAERAEKLWSRHFGETPGTAPPVWLRLQPTSVAGEPEVRLTVRSGESIRVDLRWAEDTPRSSLSYALAAGWWTRVARFATGSESVPAWLVAATAARLEVDLNPLYRDVLGHMASPAAPSLSEVMTAHDATPTRWWGPLILLEALAAERPLAVAELLRLTDPPKVAAVLPSTPGLSGAQLVSLWWATVWQAAQAQPRTPKWGMAASARRLGELEQLVVRERGEERRLGLEALSDMVGRPELPWLVERRLEAIRANLLQVHPVYHNPLLSLGRFYEAVRAGESAAARRALAAYRDDLQAADGTAEEIRALLVRP